MSTSGIGWYIATVYIHILATVFWMGYALFWTIIIGALTKQCDEPESSRLLRLINQAAWPPEGIAAPCRVTFSGLAWLTLVVLVVTGSLVLWSQPRTLQQVSSGGLVLSPFGRILAMKLLLVVGLLLLQLRFTYRPAVWLVYLNMGTALAVVTLSVLLAH